MSKDTELSILNNMLPQIEEVLTKITEKHKKVSDMSTPINQISKKMGYDYVEIGYMKHIANEEYPGWSWEIINTEVLGTEAFVVHGRLTYYVAGIKQIGDMVDSHRIQKQRDGGDFVDVGNDIKSANTDCMKKAFNMYLNIADDVYRNQVVDLDESEKMLINEKMLLAGFDAKEIARIGLNITKGKVTQLNVDDLYKWIDDKSKTKEESKGK
jgi:hypothetical protein